MFGTLDLSEKRKEWVEIKDVSKIYTGTTPSTTDETNWDGWTVHVLFIAIPKEHYQPYIVDHHEIDFIINGEPRLTC